MKKYGAFALCCLINTFLFADEALSSELALGSKNAKTAPAENKPVQKSASRQAITPSANPKTTCWADFFVTGSYIYWRPVQEGLSYALDGFLVSFGGPVSPLTEKGRVHKPHFKYASGFKAGGGFVFKYDGWDATVNYTGLRQNHIHSSTVFNPDKGSLFLEQLGINVNPNTLFPISDAAAHWKISYNTLDYELGRNYFISRRLSLRPHFGLKQAWINQDYVVSGSILPSIAIGSFRFHYDQDYTGIGVRAGLNSAWHMIKSLSVYGNFACAALWSHFDEKRKDLGEGASFPTSPILLADTENSLRTIKPVFELALGLRYEVLFHKDDFRFLVDAGWEAQYWTNHNQFIGFIVSPMGDLSLQGLTINARLDF